MKARVTATPAATRAIEELTERYGPLMLVQSGGCCDGSSPICFRAGTFLVGPDDRLLGDIAGAAFYIDSGQDERWNEPDLVLDVADGAAEGFSLEGLEGIHFVTSSETLAQTRHPVLGRADVGPSQGRRSPTISGEKK
jgi:uncharacterized protein (DUF779 family)